MQVETYEVEEINSSEAATMAADSEALELIEKLGLSGQKKLSDPDTATRVPYRRISAEEMAVYETCFPHKTKLEEYSDGIIPLRVLQIVAHAKETGFFKSFIVWHPQAGQRDPVLVAEHPFRNPGWNFDSSELFILARWGDSLLPFEELREKARKMLVARWSSKLKETIAEATAALQTIEAKADAMVYGHERKSDPAFSW